MSSKRCCIPECVESEGQHKILHLFPNPKNEIERFRTWIQAIGGNILGLSNEYVYKQRRVCNAHFEKKYCCRNNRISNIAVPTVLMPSPLSRPIFTFTETRPLSEIQNHSSTSKDPVAVVMFPDESNKVTEHTTVKTINNPVAMQMVPDVSSKGLEHTLEVNTAQTTTVNNPVPMEMVLDVPSEVPEDTLEINTNEKTFSNDSDEAVCRICLRSGFERKKEFDEKLTKFHVQLCENDVIAIQSVLAICPICEHLLRKFYNFKQKCIQVNTLLKISRASALEKYGYENLHMLIPSSIGLLKPSDRQGIYNFEHITKSFTVFPSHTVKKPVIDTVKLEPIIKKFKPVVNLNKETITQNDNLNPVVTLNRETITQNANLNPVVNLNRETITQNANLNPVVNLNRRTITQNANLNPVVTLNRGTITLSANLNPVVNLNRETITQNANLNPVVNLNRETITQNANLNHVVNLNRETITQNANLNPVVTLNRGTITLSANLNPVVRINRETMAAKRKGKLNPSIVKLKKKSKKVNLHLNFVNRKTQDTKTKSNPLPVFTPVSTKHRTNIRFDTITVTSSKKNGMNPKLNPETPNIIEPNWEPEVIAPDIDQTVIKTGDEDIQDPLLVSNSIDNTVLMQFMEDSIDMDLKEDSDETDARGNGSEDEPLTKYRRTDEEIEYLEEEYLESDYDEEIT